MIYFYKKSKNILMMRLQIQGRDYHVEMMMTIIYSSLMMIRLWLYIRLIETWRYRPVILVIFIFRVGDILDDELTVRVIIILITVLSDGLWQHQCSFCQRFCQWFEVEVNLGKEFVKLCSDVKCFIKTWKLELDFASPDFPALQSFPSHLMLGFSTDGAMPDWGPWDRH